MLYTGGQSTLLHLLLGCVEGSLFKDISEERIQTLFTADQEQLQQQSRHLSGRKIVHGRKIPITTLEEVVPVEVWCSQFDIEDAHAPNLSKHAQGSHHSTGRVNNQGAALPSNGSTAKPHGRSSCQSSRKG